MPAIIDISGDTYLNSNKESKKISKLYCKYKRQIEGMLYFIFFPCVQTGMPRLTIETGPAFLCRLAKLLHQCIIDLLTGITALYTEPFEDGRAASWFPEGYSN